MMKDSVVLYPCPTRGHLVTMLELAKLITIHHPSLSVTFIIQTPPNNETNSIESIIAEAATTTTTSIDFIRLPPASPPTMIPSSFRDFVASLYELAELNNPNLHQALNSISFSLNIKAFIIDFFCNAAVEISSGALKIPTYYHFTAGVSSVCSLLYVSTLDKKFTQEALLNAETIIDPPGLRTMCPSKNLPIVLLDRSHRVYRYFVETSIHMAKSDGLIVNSFESLELKAVKAIIEGDCTPEEPRAPPFYCIGPLIRAEPESKIELECLSWLDSQPASSVVFICFGSMEVFSPTQLMEMAIGLDKSQVRFLWVVRIPDWSLSDQLIELEYLLPDGFFERTKDRGLVVQMCSPLVKVLSHGSVGGFMTHCEWNSILESVCSGVPILAWPLYEEQNGVALLEELKLALRVTESEDGLVNGDEFAEKLSEVMHSYGGKVIRERATVMKYAALDANRDGGSSHVAMARLLESFKLSSI